MTAKITICKPGFAHGYQSSYQSSEIEDFIKDVSVVSDPISVLGQMRINGSGAAKKLEHKLARSP